MGAQSTDDLQAILSLIEDREAAVAAANQASRPHMVRAAALTELIRGMASNLIEAKDEGQVSLDVLGKATITFAREVTRKADTSLIHQNWEQMPMAVQNIFRFSADINTKALRELSADDAATAAAYYTSKVGDIKMTIKVKT